MADGFTGPQRFFLGYAMSRKGKYHEAAIVRQLARGPHSPLKYRVIGPYRNIDAVHEAFGTQPGDVPRTWADDESARMLRTTWYDVSTKVSTCSASGVRAE